MSAVDQAVAEIEANLPGWTLQREGLEDFARLDLARPSFESVDHLRKRMDTRLALCRDALNALRALLQDGYPELAAEDADLAVMADLSAQIEGMQAALARFHGPGEAVEGEIVFAPAPEGPGP